ncbi:MAG TPA: hypothetical protein ENK66_10680 [Arcobacter sp.]|nr:hypothetical protein [Arcobacter sp.]
MAKITTKPILTSQIVQTYKEVKITYRQEKKKKKKLFKLIQIGFEIKVFKQKVDKKTKKITYEEMSTKDPKIQEIILTYSKGPDAGPCCPNCCEPQPS